MHRDSPPDRLRLARFALQVGGVAFFLCVVAFANRYGGWHGLLGIPGWDTILFTDPAGDSVRAGADPYAVRLKDIEGFFWAPPWAVFFAAISWLPLLAQSLVMLAIEVASLWYLAGSIRWVAYLCWCPLLPYALSSGNIHLFICASMLAAAKGVGWPLAASTLAKLSPALALQPAAWRGFAVAMVVAVALTIPWLYLWPDWIAALVRAYQGGIGQTFPLLVRLPIGLAFVALRRPWSGALGAVIAMPAFYPPISYIMFLAPLMIWVRRDEMTTRRWRLRRPKGPALGSPGLDSARA